MKKFIIVAIGKVLTEGTDALGGDERLLKFGYKYEVTGPGSDGGPVVFAICPDLWTAQRVRDALTAAAA